MHISIKKVRKFPTNQFRRVEVNQADGAHRGQRPALPHHMVVARLLQLIFRDLSNLGKYQTGVLTT